MKKTSALLLILILLAVPHLLLAEELPSGEDLIEKFNEASGGLAAWDGHKTMKAVGTFSMPAMGISATMEAWKQAPNLIYTMIVSDSFGNMEEGCDGAVAWEKSMMTGAKVKADSELAMALRAAQFNPWAVWKDFYQSATTLGVEDVDGEACYKVKMVPNENEGEPEFNFFSVETGLLVKSSVLIVNEMGNISIDAFVSDYREVGGILVPFKARQVLMGMQEIIITFDEQTFDVEIPAGTFDLPADIKALMEAK